MTVTAPKACLRVQGTDIVDADGNRVILKGVSPRCNVYSHENHSDAGLGRYWRTHQYGELHYGLHWA